MAPISIRAEPLTSPLARALIAALDAELDQRYPEDGANHFRLDEAEVSAGSGVFLIAVEGEDALGCGALRSIDASTGEIKRMYVAPAARGRGVGRLILTALEEHARALGRRRLWLEAGARQPEAMGLYERSGFKRIAPWGEYVDSPLSICLGKELG